ncbi:arylsulfatase J [Octopus bimaculoides]|uniref:Sulfatase N-terminal domain-containing protein n=1 Tax=Octopus bimaculoides TaxID=37653 RepID=A0A0L8I733_OCTBM|nr:arylsulfatase J [Octopus bimaculoides]|eukprot:XP_014789497.1 PREDICTED: arylsulfatase J-like [Octopus bimaculoides]
MGLLNSSRCNMTSYAIYIWIFILLLKCVTAAKRPNIIIIVADDLGWNDVSFHGSNQIPTKNIDSLASEGIILNNYYVSPICTPTRSALMTGRHPIHTGMQHGVICSSQTYGLPLNETLMPEYLNKLGYTSHIVGKWHLGFISEDYTPTKRGFSSHFGYWLGAESYYLHLAGRGDYLGYDFHRNLDVAKDALGHYSTEIFTQEAVKIIKNHNETKPLFLYLPYQAVHSSSIQPYLEAPEKYTKRFPNISNKQRKLFAGMVAALDDGVGEVVNALKSSGMYDNSIILFSTDNGGPANGYNENAASNWPLRGMKNTLWEGGVRGVGFLHSPLLKKNGYISEQMVHVCDWLPTLYSAAGGNPDEEPRMKNLDGYDLWSMLSNNGKSVRTEILHNIDPIRKFAAIRVNNYKLLIGHVASRGNWYPPYNESERYLSNEFDDWFSQDNDFPVKMITHPKTVRVNCGGPKPPDAFHNCDDFKKPCLFNIASDPCEYHNVADQNPEILKYLMKRLLKYEATMVPPGNKPQDPAGFPIHHNGIWTPWLK